MSRQRRNRKRTCELGCARPVAYCHYHKCTMSARQVRNRNCLDKHCNALQKVEGHPYWVQRECENEARQRRKGIDNQTKEV